MEHGEYPEFDSGHCLEFVYLFIVCLFGGQNLETPENKVYILVQRPRKF